MPEAPHNAAYRVLARKYRPERLSELIGQDALVRTLTNAFASGRIAHAFMLTGIRGVGKTTTARIIARALNCTGPDGRGGPTPESCGVCPDCAAISSGRHIDVLEMDAASHTGINDIREIVDGVRYAPSSGRYKVYIVDEVHMLSQAAFNGLLKTLEEPPPHAKFVFATTEIRKVPVTVLSRCQRFDLKRVEAETLRRHLDGVAAKEEVAVEPEALALIVRASEGSVRDSLSLLDQAMALAEGPVTPADVRDMLGLADRGRVLDLFDALLRGEAREALDRMAELDALGADPATVVQDLLELCHGLSRAKLVPEATANLGLSGEDAARASSMSGRLSIPVLTRFWQMLLKGVEEMRSAPSPLPAAEMLLLRLAFVADLPTPAELRAAVGAGRAATGPGAAGDAGDGRVTPPGRRPDSPLAAARDALLASSRPRATAPGPAVARAPALAPTAAVPETVPAPTAEAEDFEAAVDLLRRSGEPMLASWLHQGVHPVGFEPGRIEIRVRPNVPADLPSKVGSVLGRLTGRRWIVTLSNAPGDPTLAERDDERRRRRMAEAASHPTVLRVLEHFPGASLEDVRPAGDDGP